MSRSKGSRRYKKLDADHCGSRSRQVVSTNSIEGVPNSSQGRVFDLSRYNPDRISSSPPDLPHGDYPDSLAAGKYQAASFCIPG